MADRNWMRVVKLDAENKESPIGSFYIGTDAPVQIQIDSMHMTYLVYDKHRGVFQVGFDFGGYDAAGVFHEAPDYARFPNLIHWTKASHKAVWEQLGLDALIESYGVEICNTIAEWMHQGDAAKALATAYGIKDKVASYITSEDGSEILSPIKVEPIRPVIVPAAEPVEIIAEEIP